MTSRLYLILPIVLLFAAVVGNRAHAQSTDPAVTKGVAWLQAQVQDDGSLAAEGTSTATPLQARAEVLSALSRWATAPASLITSVASDTNVNTDYLSRRTIALKAASQDVSAPLLALKQLQNVDGGWSLAPHFSSDALDTALALGALCSSSNNASQISAALGNLGSVEFADGSFGLTDTSDLYVSLSSLLALDSCSPNSAAATLATPLTTWLLSQRTAGGDLADVQFNALALGALLSRTNDSSIINPFIAALHAKQAADGSWNEDPYLTALAVQALGAAAQPPPQATTGGVAGHVKDGNGAPLAGATVQLVEAPLNSATSASDGSFALNGISPGTYTLSAMLAGYGSVQRHVTIAAGSTVDVGTLVLAPAPLTASLSGHVQDSSSNPIANALVTVGSYFVATDASGNYLLSGLPLGNATILISSSGYQSATASATFAAGVAYVFSPTLYGGTPPPTSVIGKIINSQTSAAIAGAQITLTGQTVTSLADGSFTLTGVSAGSFALTVTAPGFFTESVTGIFGSGVNNLGNIPMTPAPTTSSISGTVIDQASGAAIAGASLSIDGTSLTATTDGAGQYAITSINSTSFVVTATAAGHITQHTSVQLSSPGAGTLDFALVAATASKVSFTSITTSAPQYAPNETLKVFITAANAGASAVDLVIQADVLDSQGRVIVTLLANRIGTPSNMVNQPFSIAAGGTVSTDVADHFQHQVAGAYDVHVRGYSTTGQVLAEGDVTFTVTSAALLGGTITADPPLVQVGTNTPVHVTALLGNVGNQSIPASQAHVKVILDSVDAATNPADQANLKFVGTGSFNYVTGAVADPDGTIYSVSLYDLKVIKTAPSGQMSVAYDLAGHGAFYLRDIARDANNTFWIPAGSTNISTIAADGTIGGFNLQNSLTALSMAVDSAGNQYYVGAIGYTDTLLKRDAQGSEQILWQGGLSYPVGIASNPDGSHVVSNWSNGTLVKVAADGTITPFVSGFYRPQGIARGPDGNYYVADAGTNQIVKVTPSGGMSTYATGLHAPYGVVFNSKGELIVADQGADAILKVHPDGTTSVLARSLISSAQAIAYGSDSSLYVTQAGGIVRRADPQGNVTDLAAGLGTLYGIVVDASGTAYVTSYDTGRIERVTSQGTQDFATALSGPDGIALDSQHNMLAVTETNASRLHWFNTSGTDMGHTDSALRSPIAGALDPAGTIYAANDTYVSAFSAGVPHHFADVSATALAYNPVSHKLLAAAGTNVVSIAADGTATTIGTPPSGFYALAADDQGRSIVADPAGTNLFRSDVAGTFSLLTALPAGETLRALGSSMSGTVYMATDQARLYRVADDGSFTLLTTWTFDIRSIGVGLDGSVGIISTGGWIAIVDPATGNITSQASTSSTYCSLTRDSSGNAVVLDRSNLQMVTYDTAGNALATIDGFLYPGSLVWTGVDFQFWDSRAHVFSWIPGSYPTRLKPDMTLAQGVMAWSNGSLYVISPASDPSSIYKRDSSGHLVQWAQIGGFGRLMAIAARPDGAIAAVNDYNRLVIFDVNGHLISDQAGLSRPAGLAIDAQDRLYAALNGNWSIVRIDDSDPLPVTIAPIVNANGVAVKSDGTIYASGQSTLYSIDAQGTLSNLGSIGGADLRDIAVTAQGPIVLNGGYSTIHRYTGTQFVGYAAGLSGPNQVRLAPDGSLYIANSYNGTLTRYKDGGMSVVNAAMSGASAIAVAANGDVFFGGYRGFAVVHPDATTSTLNVPQLLHDSSITGLVSLGTNQLGVVAWPDTRVASVYDLTITPPLPPPALGTVVYQADQPLPSLAPLDTSVNADFGSWTPALAGDYRIEVSDAAAPGTLVNYIHVGASASGTLSTTSHSVPPGDVSIPLTLGVTGADSTSISTIDASKVQTLATSPSSAFTADSAGNLYYVDSTGLNSLAPSGAATLLVGGYSGTNVTADANGGIFFTGFNASSGAYELVRYSGGSPMVIYNSGTTPIQRVAVNAAGDAYLAIGMQLIRVHPDGSSAIVLDTGLDTPFAISFDGRGDLFIESSTGIVEELKPDMTLHEVFASSDGVTTPSFDGTENSMSVAGDCDKNVFISPFSWTAIGSGTEEHLLTQVLPDSGKVGLVFDGSLFGLIDMDTLIADPYHHRLLTWNDETYAITQIPVTCGSISVEAHVLTLPGQALSGLSQPANATIPHADGRIEYVFLLQNVPAEGFQVKFDAPLTGLTLGQTPAVLDSAFLLYKNTFTNQDYTVPIAVPTVQVTSAVQLFVSTDQAQYAAKSTAQLNAMLTNPPGQGAMSGTVQLDVLDSSNDLVSHVATQAVTLLPSGSVNVPGTFAVATIVPGTYVARATMTNQGITFAQSTTTFQVLADNATGEVASQIAVDKLQYNPTDQAQLISHVTNTSVNAIVSNLVLDVAVKDVGNHVLYSHAYPIAQLLPGQTLAFTSEYAFQNLGAGTYAVLQTVTDANNAALSTVSTSLAVAANAAQALIANVSVASLPMRTDQTFACQATLQNMATTAATALPLRLGILDLASGNITTLSQATTDLGAGAQWQTSSNVTAGELPPGNYACALQLQNAGTWQTLAYSSFTMHAVTNLQTLLSASRLPAVPNQIEFFHLRINNIGPDATSDSTFSVTLPAQLQWIEFAQPAPSCSVAGSQITCSLPTLVANTGEDLCFAARTGSGPAGPVLTQVNASVNAGTTIDPATANNGAGATINLVTDLVYANGFDSASTCSFTLY
jgi:sugar lactone lactonase YvrE